MAGHTFQQIISLGPDCRPKYQIQRVFGKHIAKRGVFDWQVTSSFAFAEYLDRDFEGMFERRDLAVEAGTVKNVRFGTLHNHEFPADGFAENEIDNYYVAARRRHDLICATTKTVMRNRLSTLFVLGEQVPEETISALRHYVERVAPGKKYLILEAPDDPEQNWKGTPEIWDRHLARFRIQPPLIARADYQLYRLSRNLKFALPKTYRREPDGVI